MLIQKTKVKLNELSCKICLVVQEDQDWGFVAMVLDRLFLWIFALASLLGTILILFEAPALYDTTKPIDMELSSVAKQMLMPHNHLENLREPRN